MATEEQKQQFVIETQQAIDNVAALQRQFQTYNDAVFAVMKVQRNLGAGADDTTKAIHALYEATKEITKAQVDLTIELKTEGLELSKSAIRSRTKRLAVKELSKAYGELSQKIREAREASGQNVPQRLGLPGKPLLGLPAPGGVTRNQGAIPLGQSGNAPFHGGPGTSPVQPPLPTFNYTSVTQGFNRASVAARVMQQNINNAVGSVQQSFSGLSGTVSNFGGLLDTIGRVALFQVLHRSIGALIQDFQTSATEAAEYYRQLGLIQTLSQDSTSSFGEWDKAIHRVADEFGKPITEVAIAGYEALSNQVIKSADDIDFLRSTTEFARATNSSTIDSVNLFSSAINSFGLTAQDTDKIARTFFTTIDIGRVKADELANTFGRVGPLASLLGVSFEETNAAVSALTLAGIHTNDGLTLLTNVIRTLVKPNEELTEVFRKQGFATAQDAVAALKFTGVLRLLKQEIHGSTAELAKFFPELRGLKGESVFASDQGFETYIKALEKATQGTETYANAVDIMRKNLGVDFQTQLKQVANFFTADIGGNLVTQIVKISNSFGGLLSIVKNLTQLVADGAAVWASYFLVSRAISFVVALDRIRVAILGVLAATNTLRAATTALGFATVTVTGVVTAGLTAAVAVIGKLYLDSLAAASQVKEVQNKLEEDLASATRDTTAKFTREVDKRSDTFKSGLESQKSAFFLYSADIQKSIDEISKAQEKASEAASKRIHNDIELIQGSLNSNIAAFAQTQKKAEDAIRQIHESQEENVTENQKFVFEERLKNLQAFEKNARAAGNPFGTQNAQQQIAQLVAQRASALKSQGLQFYDEGNINKGNAAFREAKDLYKQLQDQIRDGNGHFRAQYSTQQGINDLIKAQNAGYEITLQKQKQIADNAAAAEERAKLQKQDLDDIFTKIQKFTAVDKKGELLPEFKSDPSKALKELQTLHDQAFEQLKGVGFGEKLGIAKNFKEQTDSLKQALGIQEVLLDIQLRTVSAEDAKRVANEKANASVEASIAALQALGAKKKEDIKLSTDQKNAIIAMSTALQQFGTQATIFEKLFSLTGGANQNVAGGAKELTDLSKALTGGNIDVVLAKAKELKEVFKQVSADRIGGVDEKDQAKTLNTIQALDQIINKLQTYKTTVSEIPSLDKLIKEQERLAQLNQALLNQGLAPGIVQFRQSLDNLGQATTGPDAVTAAIDKVKVSAGEAQSAVARLKQALESLPPIPSEGESPRVPARQALGGMIKGYGDGGSISDFMNGKFGRGVDTVPIMAAPNEFMVRNPYSQTFKPQLEAMNSGRNPFTPQQQSTNIGDVHIHVNGGNTPQANVQEIGRGLQRAVRLGTIKLN